MIYRLNTIPITIPASYPGEIDKLILKFICKGRRPRMVKLILKKNKARRLTLSNFKTHYKSTTIKIVWYFQIQFSSVAQSCLTLCDPMDCSMPGVPVHHQLPDEPSCFHLQNGNYDNCSSRLKDYFKQSEGLF